jgi:hypothetical protein
MYRCTQSGLYIKPYGQIIYINIDCIDRVLLIAIHISWHQAHALKTTMISLLFGQCIFLKWWWVWNHLAIVLRGWISQNTRKEYVIICQRKNYLHARIRKTNCIRSNVIRLIKPSPEKILGDPVIPLFASYWDPNIF